MKSFYTILFKKILEQLRIFAHKNKVWEAVITLLSDSNFDGDNYSSNIAPSVLGFWVDDPAWVGDPEVVEELFLTVGSGRANLNPLPVLCPPLREAPDALGGMRIFL